VDSEPPVGQYSELFDDTNFIDNYWDSVTVDLLLGATDVFTATQNIEFKLQGDIDPSYAGAWLPMASAPSSIGLDPETDGGKSATATYRDSVHNESSAIIDDVTLDRTAPSVDILHPATGTSKSGIISIEVEGEEAGVGMLEPPFETPLEYRFVNYEASSWADLLDLDDSTYAVIGSTYSASGYFDTDTRLDGWHSLRVRATDKLGNTDTTSPGDSNPDEVLFKIDSDIPPAAPLNLIAIAATPTMTIYLYWESNVEKDIAGYDVYRWDATAEQAIFQADVGLATTYQDVHSATNSIASETQYYRVLAHDGAENESKWSNEASAYLGDPAPPEPPVNLRAYSGDGFVDLYWDSDLNPDLVYYNLYRCVEDATYEDPLNAEFISCPTTTVFYHDDAVQNGTEYYYQVHACYIVNTSNESLPSNEVIGSPTGGGNTRRYRWTIAAEDRRTNSFVDWDYNDMVLVMDATETFAGSGPGQDITGVDMYFELTQKITRAQYRVDFELEVEIVSGTATFHVHRNGETPTDQYYDDCSVGTHYLYMIRAKEEDEGHSVTLTIDSKSGDFAMARWLPYFDIPSVPPLYPNVYGHTEQQCEIVNIYGGSPLDGWYLDYVMIIEDSQAVTFSPYDGEQQIGSAWVNNATGNIWKHYPDFVDFILSGGAEKPYWYRTSE
jgi:hypothetical protein